MRGDTRNSHPTFAILYRRLENAEPRGVHGRSDRRELSHRSSAN